MSMHWTELVDSKSLVAFVKTNRDTGHKEWDGKWHKVNPLLIFPKSHVMLRLGTFGTRVDDENILALRNKAGNHRYVPDYVSNRHRRLLPYPLCNFRSDHVDP